MGKIIYEARLIELYDGYPAEFNFIIVENSNKIKLY